VLPIPTFRMREQEIKEQKNRDTTVSPLPRQTKPPMTYWLHFTQLFRRRLTLNLSRTWRKFRTTRIKPMELLWDKPLQLGYCPCEAATDRGVTPPPFVPGKQSGGYQLTPPNFAAADFTQWPKVTPFALARADEFRPGPPPELTSDEYTSVFDEVKSLGFIHSTTRTPEQTLIGTFWNGNIQDFWNEIAQTAAGREARRETSVRRTRYGLKVPSMLLTAS